MAIGRGADSRPQKSGGRPLGGHQTVPGPRNGSDLGATLARRDLRGDQIVIDLLIVRIIKIMVELVQHLIGGYWISILRRR